MNEICLSCRKHTKCGRAKHETIGCGYYVPMTHEEWFCQLPTEEKAKWLSRHSKFIYGCGQKGQMPKVLYEEDWEFWLKEKNDDYGNEETNF